MLTAPLFGDATLVSHETLLQAFPQIRGIGKADAYIAVWRGGVVNTEWFGEDRKNDVFMAKARERVSQIAALLSVSFLAMSTDGYLTGLDNNFLHNGTHFALIKYPLDNPGFVSSSSGPVVDTFSYSDPETLSLSKTELGAFLEQPLLQNLAHAVSAKKSKRPHPLRQSIVQSCLRIANALYEPSYTAQLLGGITTIEILLTGDENTSFDLKERRLGVLLGPELLKKYEFKKILQARHSYVHRGENETTRCQALMAIGVALYSLLIYTIIAQYFNDKNALVAYLDAVYFNDKMVISGLDPGEKLTSKRLEHIRLTHKLPFLEYVDKVIAFDKDYNSGLYDRSDRVFEDDKAKDEEESKK